MSKKIYEIDRLNFVRTLRSDEANFVEIGMGDSAPTTSKGTGWAAAEPTTGNGIAIGHDNFIDEYGYDGIALGNYQKVTNAFAIAEGSWYNKVERVGEKRRTFSNHNNLYSRSWFEWSGLAQDDYPLGGVSWRTLTLHGQPGAWVDMEDYSGIIFNIKLIGTNLNSVPNFNAYHLSGAIKRGSGAGSTAIVGTVMKDAFEDDASLDARVVADTVNGTMSLQVLAHASEDWQWAASGWVTELRFTI